MSPLVIALVFVGCALLFFGIACRACATAAKQYGPKLFAPRVVEHTLSLGTVNHLDAMLQSDAERRGAQMEQALGAALERAVKAWTLPVALQPATPLGAPPDPEERMAQQFEAEAIEKGAEQLRKLVPSLSPTEALERARELYHEAVGA